MFRFSKLFAQKSSTRRSRRRRRREFELLDARVMLAADFSIVTSGQIDSNADGIIDSAYTRSETYTPRGEVATVKFEWDHDLDGRIDDISAENRTYYANGGLKSSTSTYDTESDGNGDGVVDSTSSSSSAFTYDKSGNVLTSTYSSHASYDWDFDGVVDSTSTSSSTTANTYHKSGNLLTYLYELANVVDGVVNDGYSYSGLATNGKFDPIASSIFMPDFGLDGVDYSSLASSEQTVNGNRTGFQHVFNGNRDGVSDSLESATTVYSSLRRLHLPN